MGIFYKNHKEFFDKYAETWDEITFHNPKKLIRILSVLDLKPGQKVLDVGSGTGVMIPYLFNYVKETGSIVAIDFSENMIMISKRKHPIEKFPNLSNSNNARHTLQTLEVKIRDILVGGNLITVE